MFRNEFIVQRKVDSIWVNQSFSNLTFNSAKEAENMAKLAWPSHWACMDKIEWRVVSCGNDDLNIVKASNK